jgi:hypothetical protein
MSYIWLVEVMRMEVDSIYFNLILEVNFEIENADHSIKIRFKTSQVDAAPCTGSRL